MIVVQDTAHLRKHVGSASPTRKQRHASSSELAGGGGCAIVHGSLTFSSVAICRSLVAPASPCTRVWVPYKSASGPIHDESRPGTPGGLDKNRASKLVHIGAITRTPDIHSPISATLRLPLPPYEQV